MPIGAQIGRASAVVAIHSGGNYISAPAQLHLRRYARYRPWRHIFINVLLLKQMRKGREIILHAYKYIRSIHLHLFMHE